jgi:hypothetical protein
MWCQLSIGSRGRQCLKLAKRLVKPRRSAVADIPDFPPSSNYLSPEVVGQTYNFPNTGAVGQTAGIFEDAASGAAYLHADITSFINSLPSGFNTLPVLSDIGLTVGATTYSKSTALVTSSPTSAVGECCIDVSIVAAIGRSVSVRAENGCR